MSAPFHAGELEVQRRAGVQMAAARIGSSIRPTIPPAAQAFLALQQMVIVGSASKGAPVWASLLNGESGFARALNERSVHIAAAPVPGDPLAERAKVGDPIGLLAIDLAQRKRMRINGRIASRPGGGFLVTTEQVYANCPKYIQARVLRAAERSREPPRLLHRSQRLLAEQRSWIERADTFFIASAHPVGGVDVSHRGGNPGFVRVVDPTRLLFPDYAGNTMFQTLGNLALAPHAGLLFIDFDQGRTLQLTGRAQMIWDEERTAAFAGAERLLEFTVEAAIERAGAGPLQERLLGYSPFNPR
jgi:predicted pyridoxine 5'-phosphate oxidase superfamily flavin-nucleotide-binding protein